MIVLNTITIENMGEGKDIGFVLKVPSQKSDYSGNGSTPLYYLKKSIFEI